MGAKTWEEHFVAPYAGLDMVSALRKLAPIFDIKIIPVSGWETRRSSSYDFEPVGFIHHWTAVSDTEPRSLQYCINKALVSTYVPPQGGEIHVISNGRTGHAGAGNDRAIAELTKGHPTYERHPWDTPDRSGYRSFGGCEYEASGSNPVSDGLVETMFAQAAMWSVLCGWPAHRQIHHSHWSGRRKVDWALRMPGNRTQPWVPIGELYATGDQVSWQDQTQRRIDIITEALNPKPPPPPPPPPRPTYPVLDSVDAVVALEMLAVESPWMANDTVALARRMLVNPADTDNRYSGWIGNEVKEWQRREGLKPDGIFGPKSWSHALFSLATERPTNGLFAHARAKEQLRAERK